MEKANIYQLYSRICLLAYVFSNQITISNSVIPPHPPPPTQTVRAFTLNVSSRFYFFRLKTLLSLLH